MAKRKATKPRWETHTEALIHITTYRITHPTRKGGKFEIEYETRGPIDCYSSTLVDTWNPAGSAKTLEEAMAAAIEHEFNRRKEDDDDD